MRTRLLSVSLALCGLVLCAAPLRSVFADSSPQAIRPDTPDSDARVSPDANLPTNRPIVATVIEVDQDAGRVTVQTAHGQVALSVSQELAERLNPGDVVVLRLSEDDSDAPYASPREEPLTSGPATKI